MKIEFDKYLFNPVYWHVCKYMADENIRNIFLYGSSSAAKSYSIMQALSIGVLNKNYNVMAMRKTGADIKDSIYTDFKGFNQGLSRILSDTYDIIINEIRIKNNRIRFRGLDDTERIKGIAEFTKVYLDELTEFDFQDYEQLQKRLRGRKYQQIIGSWNPINSRHWIKRKIINTQEWTELDKTISGIPFSTLSENSSIKINKSGDTILIKTNYKDNYWIVGHPENKEVGFYDKHQITHLESLKTSNPNDYKIYALGEWGTPSEGLVFSPEEWDVVDKIAKEAKRLPCGLDFGFSESKTALVNCYKLNGELWFDCPIYETGLVNLINDIKPSIQQRFEENEIKKSTENDHTIIIADSAEVKTINELRIVGYPVYKANKKAGSIEAGLKILKSYKKHITKRSTGMIDEFETYEYSKDKFDNYNIPIKVNDHAIDAARYVMLTRGLQWE